MFRPGVADARLARCTGAAFAFIEDDRYTQHRNGRAELSRRSCRTKAEPRSASTLRAQKRVGSFGKSDKRHLPYFASRHRSSVECEDLTPTPQIRKDQGMTQVELAEAVRLSQQLIAEYEAGKKNIPVWRLVNIAEALGIAPEVLLSDCDGKMLKRGPAPKLQKQIERIAGLPREQQKSIMQVLDMALKTA